MYPPGKGLCLRDWQNLSSDFTLFFRSLRNIPVSKSTGRGRLSILNF